ncbi:hypothetical protein MKW98_026028 [Papaver atlanticum]|uniref:Uncharacterized protein n=1 Tax=Papaver atlanticum TaxID=357466 RepID=A0AAD4X5K7_9MAGN|nr:hypothetical protein MKW98_026028 [Papaver atlanticum]
MHLYCQLLSTSLFLIPIRKEKSCLNNGLYSLQPLRGTHIREERIVVNLGDKFSRWQRSQGDIRIFSFSPALVLPTPLMQVKDLQFEL